MVFAQGKRCTQVLRVCFVKVLTVWACTHTCTHVCMHVHTHTHTHTRTRTHAHVHTRAHARSLVTTHTHTHTHAPTHTHERTPQSLPTLSSKLHTSPVHKRSYSRTDSKSTNALHPQNQRPAQTQQATNNSHPLPHNTRKNYWDQGPKPGFLPPPDTATRTPFSSTSLQPLYTR